MDPSSVTIWSPNGMAGRYEVRALVRGDLALGGRWRQQQQRSQARRRGYWLSKPIARSGGDMLVARAFTCRSPNQEESFAAVDPARPGRPRRALSSLQNGQFCDGGMPELDGEHIPERACSVTGRTGCCGEAGNPRTKQRRRPRRPLHCWPGKPASQRSSPARWRRPRR